MQDLLQHFLESEYQISKTGEVKQLYYEIKKLKDEGVSYIQITKKLNGLENWINVVELRVYMHRLKIMEDKKNIMIKKGSPNTNQNSSSFQSKERQSQRHNNQGSKTIDKDW